MSSEPVEGGDAMLDVTIDGTGFTPSSLSDDSCVQGNVGDLEQSNDKIFERIVFREIGRIHQDFEVVHKSFKQMQEDVDGLKMEVVSLYRALKEKPSSLELAQIWKEIDGIKKEISTQIATSPLVRQDSRENDEVREENNRLRQEINELRRQLEQRAIRPQQGSSDREMWNSDETIEGLNAREEMKPYQEQGYQELQDKLVALQRENLLLKEERKQKYEKVTVQDRGSFPVSQPLTPPSPSPSSFIPLPCRPPSYQDPSPFSAAFTNPCGVGESIGPNNLRHVVYEIPDEMISSPKQPPTIQQQPRYYAAKLDAGGSYLRPIQESKMNKEIITEEPRTGDY